MDITNSIITSAPITLDGLTTTSIASSAMLVELSISVWGATKKERETELKVAAEKGLINARALSVTKRLFEENKILKAINSLAGSSRTFVAMKSNPWNNNGERYFHNALLPVLATGLRERHDNFYQLLSNFVQDYQNAIAADAISLNTMFNRDDYPSVEFVRSKFGFHYSFLPMPSSGHFLLDIETTLRNELVEHFNSMSTKRVDAAVKSMWVRMHSCVSKMIDKLTLKVTAKGAPLGRRFHDSFIEHFEDLVDMLRVCNMTDDKQIAALANDLERVCMTLDIAELKKDSNHTGARADTKEKLQSILDKYNVTAMISGAQADDSDDDTAGW